MKPIVPGRHTADTREPFVVFLIGMRINRWRAVRKWLPAARAMGPMMRELYTQKDRGFLSAEFAIGARGPIMVQYWRSHADLQAFAHERGGLHRSAWTDFYRRVGDDDSVGIWHETYMVEPGRHESVYVNMPRFGLGAAVDHVPAEGRRRTAEGRLREGAGGEVVAAE